MPPRKHHTCTVEGCDKPHASRGYCSMHYTRLRNHGDVNYTQLSRADNPRFCSIEGCNRVYVAKGYCKLHYYGLKRYGDPLHRLPTAGPGSPRYKGGRMVTPEGYVMVKVYDPDPMTTMRNSAGYVFEHRLVMAEALGRPLTQRETVHHVNGVRDDNRLENLQLRIGSHGAGATFRCHDCGSVNIEAVPL